MCSVCEYDKIDGALLQAVEPEFHRSQFEKLVLPNIKSNAVRCWLMEQFKNDRLRPNLLAIELTEAKNGVSKLHAQVANFRDRNNDKVKFHAITNGIDLETWVLPEIISSYRNHGIIDKFDLPTQSGPYLYLHRIYWQPQSE